MIFRLSCLSIFCLSMSLVQAAGKHAMMYQSVAVELAAGLNDENDDVYLWDIHASIGTDETKLLFEVEGEKFDFVSEQVEFRLMVSHLLDDFWNIEYGLRHDNKPSKLAYAVFGFEGLAIYFLETKAHFFVSEDADVSFRLEQEKEFLLTQTIHLQLYYELEFFAQEIEQLHVGSGLSSGEFGFKNIYEFNRDVALFFDVKYERKFGETSTMADHAGEEKESFVFLVGTKWLF